MLLFDHVPRRPSTTPSDRSSAVLLPRPAHALGPWFLVMVAVALGVTLCAPVPVFAQEVTDPGPGRWQTGDKEVVVSLGAQRLWAYEGEQVILTTLVSTGTAETPEVATPIGHWRILAKLPMETMTGTIDGEPYEVDDVPYVMYFTDEGHALHGTYWHNNFGTPMSHGCVNLPLDIAAWLYEWAPVGTPVQIVS
jgi:lipoprotein-anchoring transpeptidase ErfK/SrfK